MDFEEKNDNQEEEERSYLETPETSYLETSETSYLETPETSYLETPETFEKIPETEDVKEAVAEEVKYEEPEPEKIPISEPVMTRTQFYNNDKPFPEPEVIENMYYSKKRPRKTASGFKTAITIVTIISVFGGVSLGLGIGMGIPIAQKYILKQEPAQQQSFKLPQVAYVSQAADFLATSTSFADVISRVEPSVVTILSRSSETSASMDAFGDFRDFFGNSYDAYSAPTEGEGSGILFHADEQNYYVVTNNHVVTGSDEVLVSIEDKGPFEAKLIGKSAEDDISVISISIKDVADAGIDNVTLAVFGDSDETRIGDVVLAIGNALGEGNTVTNGIISAKNKQVITEDVTYHAIQTNAQINSGNSGGPLVNLSGEVIGINSAKYSSDSYTSVSIEGMGYAIPSNQVKEIIEQLMGPKKPLLGIVGGDIGAEMAQQYGLPQAGVFISETTPNTPASEAGLQYGDVITSFNGTTIFKFDDLKAALAECTLGDTVEIKFIRNGNEFKTISVELFPVTDESF
ncbi:MAG: trypsin-like peptidase domain-containing protein [Clostridiales bacterium]|jgi:serine protease Do|nr:trypsin-like peptidase domain-containing protein [Clostridiales bacterium]